MQPRRPRQARKACTYPPEAMTTTSTMSHLQTSEREAGGQLRHERAAALAIANRDSRFLVTFSSQTSWIETTRVSDAVLYNVVQRCECYCQDVRIPKMMSERRTHLMPLVGGIASCSIHTWEAESGGGDENGGLFRSAHLSMAVEQSCPTVQGCHHCVLCVSLLRLSVGPVEDCLAALHAVFLAGKIEE